jgi:HSP20 family protein
MKFLPTFHSVFDDFFDDSFMNQNTLNTMRTDIVEKDNQYLLSMELPGYQKEDIQMELKDGYLLISASQNKNTEEKDEAGRIIRRERYSGSCSRQFYVGDVHQEDIKASFENGELKITFPKNNIHQVENKTYIPID